MCITRRWQRRHDGTLSQMALQLGRRLLGQFGRQQTPLYDRAVHDLSCSWREASMLAIFAEPESAPTRRLLPLSPTPRRFTERQSFLDTQQQSSAKLRRQTTDGPTRLPHSELAACSSGPCCESGKSSGRSSRRREERPALVGVVVMRDAKQPGTEIRTGLKSLEAGKSLPGNFLGPDPLPCAGRATGDRASDKAGPSNARQAGQKRNDLPVDCDDESMLVCEVVRRIIAGRHASLPYL